METFSYSRAAAVSLPGIGPLINSFSVFNALDRLGLKNEYIFRAMPDQTASKVVAGSLAEYKGRFEVLSKITTNAKRYSLYSFLSSFLVTAALSTLLALSILTGTMGGVIVGVAAAISLISLYTYFCANDAGEIFDAYNDSLKFIHDLQQKQDNYLEISNEALQQDNDKMNGRIGALIDQFDRREIRHRNFAPHKRMLESLKGFHDAYGANQEKTMRNLNQRSIQLVNGFRNLFRAASQAI